ncbi:MAG: VOC family protein [Syntrophaceae bacterium]|nr:VOC family protein [Syntrophaceae bacterium]
MIKGVGHIGIAVSNIEEILSSLSKILGISPPPIRDVPERKLKVSVVSIGGMGLEIIEDYSGEGQFAKFVRERGNAIHHICLLTDQIEADIELLKSRGIEMADPKPKIGVRGKKIAFAAPSALNGITLELSEP